MQNSLDYEYYIADLEHVEGVDFDDNAALMVTVDKWGNTWEDISSDDDIDIRLLGD